jgi:hypothetical protein
MATRTKKFKPVLPIVWEDIQERCARMDVKPSFSAESGIVLRIGDHVFAGLSVLEAAKMLQAAVYAAMGYECYACMRVTLNAHQSSGFRLCTACINEY